MTVTKNKFGKRLCAYSAAVGAAATAGMALDANAAPIIYDTEASPINVHSSFNTLPNGQNMAAIDPTVLGASTTVASTTPTAAGLLGMATGGSDNSGITNAQLAGTVYFRYEIFSEPSATWGKSGTQFGILTGAGNGLYAVSAGASTQPAAQGGIGGFDEGGEFSDAGLIIFFISVIAALVFGLWNTIVRMGKTGQSLGRKFLSIAVLTFDGQPIGMGNDFLR